MAEAATIPPLAMDSLRHKSSSPQPLPALGPQHSDISTTENDTTNSFVPPAWLPSSPSAMTRQSSQDPHRLPTFDSTALINPPEPILYLPPLLSSLPAGYSHVPQPHAHYGHIDLENRLPEIDDLSLALHKALHAFRPLTEEYSTTPYPEAFNWGELSLPEDAESEWYAVVFRSKRTAGSDGGPLYEADKLAHEEAVRNGGLILYWYGIPHPQTGLNMATCIWRSRVHAMGAMSRPHHVNAMRLAAASYDTYTLERHRLIKKMGETTLRVVPYDKGDSGW